MMYEPQWPTVMAALFQAAAWNATSAIVSTCLFCKREGIYCFLVHKVAPYERLHSAQKEQEVINSLFIL